MIAARTELWLEPDGRELTTGCVGSGRYAAFVGKAPTRSAAEPCEDVAGFVSWADGACALLVADGVGGHRGGDVAARLVAETIASGLAGAGSDGDVMRSATVGGIEAANRELLERYSGAATTILVALLSDRELRSCHAGDSELLVVGQRGKIKHRTVSHSPVGYGVEAGLIDQVEGLQHANRHVISNCVGMQGMRVEVASEIRLAVRDTVVLASDGLWDNLHVTEVAEVVRKGPLARAVEELAGRVAARMRGDDAAVVAGKPDDVAIVLYRAS